MENFIDVGTQLHLTILFWGSVALIVIAIGLAVLGFFVASDGLVFSGAMVGSFGALAFIGWLLALVPFDAKYHQMYRVSGEVTSVSNVITESSGDLTRTPVLTLDTVNQDIAMSDPRAVNLEGKQVDLTCTVEWVYQGADRYNCKIYAVHN